MNQPRIKILQYMHGTCEYFPWSEWINRRYCERHGYDYVLRRDKPRTDRHVCWHKVPIILEELCDCDYLLFVDADAVFYSHELTLENELIPALEGKPILMAADCGKESLRWQPGRPNSGVILVKNEQQAREFFTEWNSVSEIDEGTRWKWPPTQLALWRHVFPKFKDDLRIVTDYYIVQGRLGQFIRHYCLCSDEERTKAMKTIYKRLAEASSQESEVRRKNNEVELSQSIPTKPIIKIVQYHWGDENHSYAINRQINEAYCRRHGYDLVVKTFPPREDRASHWSKIPAIREELHDCDYLLYLDADAFFYSHELRIEDELLLLIGDKEIMMSANCAGESDRLQKGKPNTGVILVRNSSKAAEILRIWDESSERPGLERFRFDMDYEQETCAQTIWQECSKHVKLLKDYYLMNGINGIFIRHLMGIGEKHRFRIQKQFLANHSKTDLIANTPLIRLKIWKWGIGMLSTTYRSDGSLARTLESYRNTGFAPPIVFTDLERRGGLWNLYRALKTLVEQYPDADAYMIAEDDILFSKDIREYLESELWASVSKHGCICSIFTPTIYSSEKRWKTVNRGSKTWMSQCRVYHPLTAKKLVADLENDKRLKNRWRQNDAVIGAWAKNNNVDIWFHNPSLVQHVSSKSTSYGTNKSLNYRLGMARDFVGENRSIHEYLQMFGTEPRKIRTIPKLEVFCEGTCPKDGTEFLFTPEMAQNLANKLDQYNCDIGEITFVGDEPLAWHYVKQCIHILRITGKIFKTKMKFSLTQEVDLKPYEMLFDAIDIICNDATQMHLIEKHVFKNPFYTLFPKDHATPECHKTLRLYGNEVFLCGHQIRRDCGCESLSEDSRHWTLDEFFQNIDDLLSEIEKQELCQSCPVLDTHFDQVTI